MSSPTIATLARISPESLASRLRQSPASQSSNTAIIDVRDSDFIGGHIRGCINLPTSTHDHAMPELVRKLADKEVVVFHCALSQQRGPGSALRYLRERERMGVSRGGEEGKEGKVVQKVVVLEGGFSRWQELYGEDKELTEGYQKDIWEFGGW
ncbi:Rhodanese-like domain-containing protein [Elsinoe fawcettii]|nr:Rhodanese-like domain-containing protein [Elsinoe fawcettii]